MRVHSFSPPHSMTTPEGLSPLVMKRLGQVVVLAGRNGSGKTRVLTVLNDGLAQVKKHWEQDDATIDQSIANAERYISQHGALLPPEMAQRQQILADLVSVKEARKGVQLSGPPNLLQWPAFIPTSDDLIDPATRTRKDTEDAYLETLTRIGMASASELAPVYVDHVAARSFNAKNPETRLITDDERTSFIQAWVSLQEIVEQLLPGADLGRNVDGNLTLFSRPIRIAKLSPGQRALFRIAVALHAQSTKLDEAILILDEPENHLHPDTLIEFIDRLIKATPKGQIWIATHSIHVLSHVSPDSVWYVEKGSVSWAGRRPERVLRSLVGDSDRVGRLERFMHLPSVYALERFAAEMLQPPAILVTGAEDPQSKQIYTTLESLRTPGTPLRVLDYGAGQGRILATLRQGDKNLGARIDYRAFEPDSDVRPNCIDAVADAYGIDQTSAAKCVYGSEDDVCQRLRIHSVDVAVMCNVLHEILPTEWRSLFTERILTHSLKSNGYLLLLEDMKIPYGEKAHKFGFILLDTEQLQTLFAVNREDPDEFVTHCDSADARLKAHLIRADVLSRVTDDTVKASLKRRLASAGDRIQDLRKREDTYENGRLLALYLAIYANTSLALNG